AEYSQKWHNGTSRGRSTKNTDGLAAIQAQLNNLRREIKKVNEKVYAAQVRCEQCNGPHYTKDCPQKEEGKTLEEAYYTQFGGPFQGGGYRATALGYYQKNNANPSFQERRQSMEDTLSKFMSESNSTLLYKSRQTTVPFPGRLEDHYCEEEGNYGPKFTEAYKALVINNTIPRKEKDPRRLGELAHTRLTVELADTTVKYPKGIAENILVGIVGEEKIIFKSVKPASSIIRRVYMLSLSERMELDLEARLMRDTLVLNRSLDPFLEDYIELNDLNEPFKPRRNQGDNLIPTIEEGEVIEEFITRNKDLDTGINDYPILENMDAYRDNEMGDVIFGEPFLREVGIKTRRFNGIITLYNGDDEDLVKEISTNIGGEFTNLENLEVLES
ncbi:ribonuclease H-like domain-containing protein, partial [Tanacetum coccineum]